MMKNKKMDIANVLTAKYSLSFWSLSENDYNTLEWFSETEKPTLEELILHDAQMSIDIEVEKIAEDDILITKKLLTQSAIKKLEKLGLTTEEAQAIIGL
jgi:hypothetical protein